jgi:hypothetical protein
MGKLTEIREEFKSVFSGRGSRLLDSFIPLLVFLIANPLFGSTKALWAALGIAGLIAVFRIATRNNLLFSLGGIGGVLVAALFVNISGSESGFFLPGLISGAITVLVCILSLAFRRPLVAWSSFIARRWPLNWYWHPKVLPAYSEVTIIWALAFSARLALEYWLFQENALSALGASKVFLGWPYTILLLIGSYLYGLWRLTNLRGPSVEEFKAGKELPWEGQRRGF